MLGGVLFVQDSVFEKNAATLLGGALCSFGTAMVSVANGGTGAAVTSVNLKGVTFRANTAETGGAILLGSGSTLTMAGGKGRGSSRDADALVHYSFTRSVRS